MPGPATVYDIVIVGAGHNGLVAAGYLAQAGLSVLMLEKNDAVGGATCSRQVFPGIDARVSVYAYLVSLLPQQILTDLGIRFATRRRATASFTPVEQGGSQRGLLISNVSEETTRQSFIAFTGDEREYRGYRALEEKVAVFARKVWPTLLSPLPSKAGLRDPFGTPEERQIWDYLVEKPLSHLIEDHLSDDTVRGAVFTDAKIGVSTYPEDPTLLQNRTYLYHVIGQGTGEWRVPVGGMGALTGALEARAAGLGVRFITSAEVTQVIPGQPRASVVYTREGREQAVDARWVLFNTASHIANRCLPGVYAEEQVPGSVFKVNMILRRLPRVNVREVSPQDAFSGTFHLYEGYDAMRRAHQNARAGVQVDAPLPGEMYCHSLTDPSILSADLQAQGYHTLTLFGLDVPYDWFAGDAAAVREAVLGNYLRGMGRFIADDLDDCLARDATGAPCVEARSPVDLEASLGLPKGNIFHGNLTWPFAEREEDVGTWGVETRFPNILICGSSAKRGGAVSGIPGHNAAMAVLGKGA